MWFYNQRAGAENLMKKANNEAGLSAHPSGGWAPNCLILQQGRRRGAEAMQRRAGAKQDCRQETNLLHPLVVLWHHRRGASCPSVVQGHESKLRNLYRDPSALGASV